jgi:hypothetical protein
MMKTVAFVVLAVLLSTTSFAYKTYEGYKVFRITPENADQVAALNKMNNVLGFEVDFWRSSSKVGRYAEIMVAPEHVDKVIAFLGDYKIKPQLQVANVRTLVDESMKEIMASSHQTYSRDPSTFPLNQYHSVADINAFVQDVATTYSSCVTLNTMGKSLQNRDMLYLKIGNPSGQTKRAVFIDAGIHAREWIAPATAVYVIYQLASGCSSTYKTLLDAIDIYVAPSVNPDGYEYSRSNDRMWRKTRSGPRQGCYGVDPNRNWSFHWGESGTSNSPCSEIYLGPSAFSEIECVNLRRVLDSLVPTAYLTLHSYGEDMIYPWGYATHTYPPDVAELRALGVQAGAAIQAVHGTSYIIDNSADSLYPAAGASDDYSKSIGSKWVYTIEMRPGASGSAGFNLPANQIIPNSEEVFAGILVVANRVMNGPN